MTFSGFVVLSVALWRTGEHVAAALGVAGTLLGAAMWLPSLGLRVAVLATGSGESWAALEPVYAHFRGSNEPFVALADSWRAFLLLWTYGLSTFHKILASLVCATFALALARQRLVNPASGRVLGGVSLGVAAPATVGRPLFAIPVVQAAWAVATIPFTAYVLPYFVGACKVRRGSVNAAAGPLPGTFLLPGREQGALPEPVRPNALNRRRAGRRSGSNFGRSPPMHG